VQEDIEIVGEITSVETIASGSAVRRRRLLSKAYGTGKWRKLKGTATVRFPDGFVARAEVHWFEAHGRGRYEIKVKRLLR
jgi:hypothetical protein